MIKNNDTFVFFGTPRFAEIFLSGIISHEFIPSLVVTNPDRPMGRKKIITPPPVKILAQHHNIPIVQPEELSEKIEGYTYGVVAAYGTIIPEHIINSFPKGIICVHPSLLPKYRGATPIQSALLAGDEETGTSLFLIDKEVDHGPLLAEEKIKIEDNDNYESLENKLAQLGAKIFKEYIPQYLNGILSPKNQNHTQATFTKKIKRSEGFIPWEKLQSAKNGTGAFSLCRKIKALSTEPGAWTEENGKQIKLLDCTVENEKLVLTKIQKEGKKPEIIA